MTRATLLLTLLLASLAAVSFGQNPPEFDKDKKEAPAKVDWPGLRALLESGEYAKATTSANVIIEAVKPDRKAPDFVARSMEKIEAFMRRGFAELQLGQLDAAEASFVAAQSVFDHREVQKQLATWKKKADPRWIDPIINLDLLHIEILHLRSAVLLERMRRVHAMPAADANDQKKVLEDVAAWNAAIHGFVQTSSGIRKGLAPFFVKGGLSVGTSPYKQVLMTDFHQELIAGIEAGELSCLPWTLPAVATTPETPTTAATPSVAGLNSSQLRARALSHFEVAAHALAKGVEAALPKGLAMAPADKLLEVEVLRVQLSLARCAVLIHERDVPAARKEIDQAMKVLSRDPTLAVQRRVSKPAHHPDFVVPQLMVAEIYLVESEESFKAGLIDEARVLVTKASAEHAKAAGLPLADDHPRRRDMARIAIALESHASKIEAFIGTNDAAEVAARRVRRAVEGTAFGD